MTPPSVGVPAGFRLRVDARTQRHDGGRLLLGGSPRRALRLTDAGAVVAARLLAGAPVRTGIEATLARRLLEGGIAHPLPPSTDVTIEVVVPVYEDAAALDSCLQALGRDLPVTVVDDGSSDAVTVAEVARAHAARLVRLAANRGPAAARNAGVATSAADVVAFVDADAVADVATLHLLAAHLADPLVAAAAPRVRPRQQTKAGQRQSRVLAAFADASSPLDLGATCGPVAPAGRITYVPSTVLVVRRSALLAIGGFDESLRYGEDVDLVWRLVRAGLRVRYEPTAQVGHEEPTSWPAVLRRRFWYGTSAGELARRHGNSAAPLVIAPAPAAAVALTLAGQPALGAAVAATTAWRLRRRLRAVDVPAADATRAALAAPAVTALAAARWATQLWGPAIVAVAVRSRHARPAAIAALVAPPLVEWVQRRPAVDPLRWTLAMWADDAAYGLGVWRGCVTARTTRPLRPRVPGRDMGIRRDTGSRRDTGFRGDTRPTSAGNAWE